MKWFLKTILPFCFIALTSVTAYGIPALEVPADGIDDVLQTGGSANGTKGSCPSGFHDATIGNGCDKNAPGCDRDGDGYCDVSGTGEAGAGIDCNPSSKLDYPGVYTPVLTTGYHQCLSSGSYSVTILNSVTPLCEAPAGSVCKYVDCASGNDAAAGTFAAPYRTLTKVSSLFLSPGDHVYLVGSGVCSTPLASNFGGGTVNTILDLTHSGTALKPIVIDRYPGSTATILNTAGPAILNHANYIDFVNLDISAQYGGTSHGAGILNEGSNIHFRRLYVHDTLMHGDNNDACIYSTHTNSSQVDHSFFKNCRRGTGNIDNISGVTWLDDGNDPAQCRDHSAMWNTTWYTTPGDADNGFCYKEKHGCHLVDTGSNGLPLRYDACVAARRFVQWESSGLRLDNSIGSGIDAEILQIRTDYVPQSAHEGNEITNDTFVNSGVLGWTEPTFLTISEHLKINKVLIRDNRVTFSDHEGMIDIDPYGTDARKSLFDSRHELDSNNSCYFDPSVAQPPFNYFMKLTGSGAPDGPAGSAGATYDLAGWQANVTRDPALSPHQDPNTFLEDWAPDGQLLPTSTNCPVSWGRQWVAGPTPVPTPTPTPTATPTPGPTPTATPVMTPIPTPPLGPSAGIRHYEGRF